MKNLVLATLLLASSASFAENNLLPVPAIDNSKLAAALEAKISTQVSAKMSEIAEQAAEDNIPAAEEEEEFKVSVAKR